MSNYLKKIYIFLVISTLMISSVYCDDGWDEFEDFVFEETDVKETGEQTRGLPDSLQATLFSQTVSKPLYRNTFSPRSRDPLYLVPQGYRDYKKKYSFSLYPFYNHTNRVNVSLGDAFSLDFQSNDKEQDFFSMITENLGAGNPEDFSTIVHLLKKLSVEERKTGGLVRGRLGYGPLFLSLDSSLLLVERNLVTSQEDEDRIRELVTANFGSDQTNEIDLKGEFVRQRIGLGDTRLSLGIIAIDQTNFKTILGFSGILPSSVGALLDGHFNNPRKIVLSDFGDDLERVRTILLNPKLGNNKHWGIGLFNETKLSMFDDVLSLWARVRFENFIPNKESRLVMFKPRMNIQQVVGNLDLLGDFKRQFIAPTIFDAIVNQGSVLTATVFGDLKINKRWTWGLGYDFYLKQREEIEKIISSNEQEVGSNINLLDLNIDNAENPTGVQHKVMTELNYNVFLRDSSLSLGIGADYSLAATNLGKDWTVYTKFGWKF